MKLLLKKAYTLITFWEIPTYTIIRTYTLILNFKISSHQHCYSDSTLIQHLRVGWFLRLNRKIFKLNGKGHLISTYKHFYILVCEMTANPGLTSIVGPLSASAANHVQNMANQMHVPHIETRYDFWLPYMRHYNLLLIINQGF